MLKPDSIFGLIVPTLQLPLLVLLIRRKHYRLFPFFCTYTAYSILASTLRFWTIGNPRLYFLFFWITEGILALLELLVLHEAFKPSLMMDYEQHPKTRLIVPGIILGILGYALYRAAYHPVGRGPLVRLATGAYSLEVGVRLLEVTIFVLALKLARRKHHPIGLQHPYGIVIGLGAIASVALLADLLRWKFGYSFEALFRYLPASAYVSAAGIWLLTFARKEPPRNRATPDEIQKRLDYQKQVLDWLRHNDHHKSIGSASALM